MMSPHNEERGIPGLFEAQLPESERRHKDERPSAAQALRSFVKHLHKKDSVAA